MKRKRKIQKIIRYQDLKKELNLMILYEGAKKKKEKKKEIFTAVEYVSNPSVILNILSAHLPPSCLSIMPSLFIDIYSYSYIYILYVCLLIMCYYLFVFYELKMDIFGLINLIEILSPFLNIIYILSLLLTI